MKKFIKIISIIVLLIQLIPAVQSVEASGLYSDVYNSGDLYMPLIAGGSVYNFDSTSTPKFNSSATISGLSGIWGSAFLTNGDMILLENSANPWIHCYTAASNYTSTCWAKKDLTTLTGGANTAGQFSFVLYTDQYDNIWIPFTNTDYSGKYVARVYSNSSPYDSVQLLDLSFENTVLFAPGGVGIDHNGDLWVASWYRDNSTFGFADLANYNNKIYCFDRSNNYASCSGSSFDSNGGITTPYVGPMYVVVDDNNNIFASSYIGEGYTQNKYLMKFDRANNFISSSVALPKGVNYGKAFGIAIDSLNRIFITSHDDSSQILKEYIDCFSSDLVSCGTIIFEGNDKTLIDEAPSVFIDKNDNIWSLNAADQRLYCFDSANSFKGCAQTGSIYAGNNNFTNVTQYTTHLNSYLTTAAHTAFDGNGLGFDLTGNRIYRTFKNSAGQDQATITATVDPTISFTIRDSVDNANTNTCSLGSVKATDVSEATCSYRLAVSTNASSGYNIYIQAGGPLTDGSHNITDISNGGSVAAGTEGYGIRVTGATSGVVAGGTISEATDGVTYDFSTDDTPIPTTKKTIISSDKPAEYTAGSTATSTLITHALGVSNTTPAGSYTQTITYTVTGNF